MAYKYIVGVKVFNKYGRLNCVRKIVMFNSLSTDYIDELIEEFVDKLDDDRVDAWQIDSSDDTFQICSIALPSKKEMYAVDFLEDVGYVHGEDEYI